MNLYNIFITNYDFADINAQIAFTSHFNKYNYLCMQYHLSWLHRDIR